MIARIHFSFCAGWLKVMLFNTISWENTDKKETLNLIAQSSRCNPDNVPFKINALMLLMSCVGGKENSCVCVRVCRRMSHTPICRLLLGMFKGHFNDLHRWQSFTSCFIWGIAKNGCPFWKKTPQSSVFCILSIIAVEYGRAELVISAFL